MVPTFSFLFAVPPPLDSRPARNGWNYDAFAGPTAGLGRRYSPASQEFDHEDMGAVPAAVLARPDRRRGDHPLCSFSAVGPLAQLLISSQQPLNVYAPLKALAEASGWVVLMGVGLDKLTLLHYAEQLAGRTPFRRWANDSSGRPVAVEAGGCSDGFDNFRPILAPILKEITVGQSTWRVFPAQEALAFAAGAIRQQPALTHCHNPHCDRCNDAVAGGPIH
jgi:aminoglycoside 3-N-acetyltransferase